MKTLFCSGLILISLLVSCQTSPDIPQEIIKEYPSSFTVSAENASDLSRVDATVSIDIGKIQSAHPDFNPKAFVVFNASRELPSQAVDTNGDSTFDRLNFLANFNPRENKQFQIYYSSTGEKKRTYPKRTQAELSRKVGGEFKKNKEGRYEYIGGHFKNVDYLKVPPQHSDHSWYIRYEGPGWESDKVGYRFYLDWRNAIDIFGKKVPTMVLQDVGQDGFDSYHEMSDWGMDILKVGDALGIGGIGMWADDQVNRVSVTDSVTCQIVADGPIHSEIRTLYYGWKVDDGKYNLTSNLSINAGRRMTWHDVAISGTPPNLCTGIVKHENVSVIKNPSGESEWDYLATYGKQSLAGDKLGMAVLYRKIDLIKSAEDKDNYVLVLKPDNGKLHYYFLAAWEQEKQGITDETQFRNYLETVRQELNHPLKIEL